MARYIGIPILLLAAVLNATVMAQLRIWQGAPDLVFLLVVSWALLSNYRDALLWAVIGGVLLDLFSIAPLGTSALGLVVIVFLSDSMFGQITRHNLVVPPLVVAAGTLIYHLVALGVLWMVDRQVPLGRALLYATLPTTIYNLIFILPVFRLVGLVHGWLTPRRVRLE
jgi:rod shape-determining protein MreD